MLTQKLLCTSKCRLTEILILKQANSVPGKVVLHVMPAFETAILWEQQFQPWADYTEVWFYENDLLGQKAAPICMMCGCPWAWSVNEWECNQKKHNICVMCF